MKNKFRIAALAMASMLALVGCQARGDSDTSGSLEGETVTLVVPFDPGGGYDNYARHLAPELADELGAKVVVINEPGAGGLLAMNKLSSAKPDGTTIEIFNMTGAVGGQLAGAEGVQYDMAEFDYIGQLASEPDVVIAADSGDIKSYDDLVAAADEGGLRFAATGPGSNEYIDPLVLEEVLDIDNEIVTGFAGSGDAALALLSGNVDAYSRSLGSQLPTITSGDGVPLLVLGTERVEEFADVPTMLEVAPDDKAREILEFHARLLESGRTIVTAPGTDEATLKVLRDAFAKVVQDEAFAAEGEKAGRPITFKSGEEVEATVSELVDPPEDYVSILRAAYEG